MSRTVSLLALSLGLAATPAFAQYGPPAGPPPVNYGPAPERAPFTGLRVEGLAGYDSFGRRGHSDGVSYSVAAGYDVQYRGLVVGVEGEVGDSNIKDCYGARTSADPRVCARLNRDLYVGGRVGTVVANRALVYAKAGYANTRVGGTYDDGSDRFHLGHDDLNGARLGAGVEYNLFSGAYVKAEYRYTNYERGFDRDQVVGGFGVRF